MDAEFDFIVVGGGTSGSVVASRLARTPSAPKVLLLEGGGLNDDPALRSPEQRWSVALTEPLLNWGYKSTPQNQLLGQEIPCARGRGLGGCSAINFSCWLLGHKEDFNEWANQVGDPCWKWEGEGGVKERFRRIENVHCEVNDEQARKYLDMEAQSLHSKNGAVDLSYDQIWTDLERTTFEAAEHLGIPLTSDINSGDPTGFGVGPSTYYKGHRVTASTAYLTSVPSNLTIMVDSFVTKVIFDNSKKAIGVETLTGKTYRASKEVIVSAGSLDTPKVLLLSGIGPAADLSALSIPVIKDLPVGKNLIDHCFVTTTVLLKPETPAPPVPAESSNPIVARDPLLQTGPQCPMAWISSPTVRSSDEFEALDEKTKDFLKRVPTFELVTLNVPLAAGLPELGEGAKVMTFLALLMNPQSTGSVTLASKDPSEPALIDLNYLSHPYDRRVIIEGLRTAIKLSETPGITQMTEKRIDGPGSDADDETLLEHCKKSASPVWHFAGSCKMGRDGDETAVVDKDFRVKGVRGLRVVDLSVTAVLPNNHPQSTAYLVGETAAEKMIGEYGLEDGRNLETTEM